MDEIQHFINYCVYFNSFTDEKERETIRSLVLEVCKKITVINLNDFANVIANIEFIVYKQIEGDNVYDVTRRPDGGVTLRCEIERSETQKSCWRCFVIYYPLKGFQYRETQLFILAHEFAHALFQHPINNPHPSPSELEKADYDANKKAIEWGFKPHDDDIGKNAQFMKYFGKSDKKAA